MADPKKNDVDTEDEDNEKKDSSESKNDDKSAQRQSDRDAEKVAAKHHEDAEDKLGSEADTLFDNKLLKNKKQKALDDADLLLKNIFADAQGKLDGVKKNEPGLKGSPADKNSPISQESTGSVDALGYAPSSVSKNDGNGNGNGSGQSPDAISSEKLSSPSISPLPVADTASLVVPDSAHEIDDADTTYGETLEDGDATSKEKISANQFEASVPDEMRAAADEKTLASERPIFKPREVAESMDPPTSAGRAGGGGKWDEFKIGVRDSVRDVPKDMRLPDGDVLIIGRNSDSDVAVKNEGVSRRHAMLTQHDGKVFIQDLASKNGTAIFRDGQRIPVGSKEVELKPGDQIRLGADLILPWGKQEAPKAPWKPAGYQPEKVEPSADQAVRDNADIAASKKARDASNVYLKNHEYTDRIPDGFQVVGGRNLIDEKGQHNDNNRPSYIVDTRPGKDPALTKFLEDCKRDLAHLKDRPEELAREIAKRAKAVMEPPGWSNAAVDQGYYKLRAEHAGGRLMLGDFIEAAKRGAGAGVCNHEAILTKVAFDSFYPNDAERPQMKIVRGFCGDNAAGLATEDAMNHVWTTLNTNGREKIFDPRQMIYGEPREARPSHNPGAELVQLRPQDAPVKPVAPDKVQDVYDRLVGKQVGYRNQVWQILSLDSKTGQAVIAGSGMRDESVESIGRLNPGKELRIGETYKVTRSNGSVDDGWRLVGYKDPDTKKELMFTKDFSYQRTVSIDELKRGNEAVFGDAQRQAEQKVVTPPVKPAEAPAKAKEYGLEPGREVSFGGRKWVVNGVVDGKVEIARPSERILGGEEYRRLNGDHVPKPGEEINYQRSTGEVQKWRVVSYDESTGEVRVRHESAVKEKVSLPDLLHENPDIRQAHKALDVKSVLADPRSKVTIDCRWTDGNSGHELYIGSVEGANGERVKVMIHKPPLGGRGSWVRADNDLAAQKLAERMGAPGLFPATVMRDGMMVQKFVGSEGANLHTYLHMMSREDGALRAKYSHLDERIFHMMDKVDPKLRMELARTVAFSALLGDHDQHGLNFVVEKTGPNPGDVAIARIDTDYSFNKDGKPQIDRKGNYGGSINGVFKYFSEKEIPAEVRAQIKQVSDELNPADPSAKSAAREKFARETKLSIQQVNALAERALTLSETGKFPKSIDVHAPSGTAREADVLGTAKTASFDLEKAAADLAKAGLKAEAVDRMKAAYAELSKDSVANAEALETIKQLSDTTNDMDRAKRQALIDLVAVASKDSSLPIDFQAMRDAKTDRVVAASEIINKLSPLDKMVAVGISAETVEKIKGDIARLAQTQPDKIPELAKAVEVLSQPGFAKNFGQDRMKAFAELISIPERNNLLEVPYSHFLDPKVSRDFIQFAGDRYKEAAIGFQPPRGTDSRGVRYEHNASIAAMKACKEEIPGKGKLIFIPAGNGSQADASGVDGIFLDPKGDRVYPVDWTTNMASKEAKGKATWASSPSFGIIGEHVPVDGRVVTSNKPTDEKLMRDYVKGFVGSKPSVEVAELVKDRVPFPSMGTAAPAGSMNAEISGLKRFLDHFRSGTPANPVLAELYLRTKNAIPHYDAMKGLSERLISAVTQDIFSSGRRDGSVVFDPTKAVVREDSATAERDVRKNELTGKTMKYMEIDLDKALNRSVSVNEPNSRDSTITKVRLYEDGTMVGIREFRDRGGAQVKEFELGHVKDLAAAVETRLIGMTQGSRQADLRKAVSQLADVSAGNVLNFAGPDDRVRVFGEAVTQGGPISIAANRVRSLDDIMNKVKNIDEQTAGEIFQRTAGRTLKAEEFQRVADSISLEKAHNIDSKAAESILAKRDALVKAEKVDAGVATEAAVLELVKSKSAADALELAKSAAEIRALKPALSAEQVLNLAHIELASKTLMPEAAGQAEFKAALKNAIQNAKPGEEIKSIYEHLKREAQERATGNIGSDGWYHTYYALEEMNPEKLAKSLGIPDGASGDLIKERLDLIQERLKETDSAVIPSAVDKLNVNKDLLNADLIGRFHEKINEIGGTLKDSPFDAGVRLKDAVFDFLKGEGIKDPLLNEKNTEFEISKEASKISVEYSAEGNKKVVKIEGKFYLEGSKTELAPDKVSAKVIVPEGLLRGSAGELSRAVFSAVVDQTFKGPESSSAADRAGVRDFVSKSLAKHTELSTEVGTVTSSGALDVSKLPVLPTKAADLEITAKGIKIGGVDREISFAELWDERVKGLKEKLHAEEQKSEKDQDKKKIAELKAAIEQESKFVAELKNPDPKNVDRLKAEARAKELIKGFHAAESDIDRLAREKGPGGEVRGRLVALTILVSAFIAYREKASAAQPAESKSGVIRSLAPAHEEVPNLPASDAPASKNLVPEAMDGPGSGKKIPNHEDLADKEQPAAAPEKAEKAKDATEKVPDAKLEALPDQKMVTEVLKRLLPEINKTLALEKEKAIRDKKPEVAMIDEQKLKAEWSRGEFGPESRLLWAQATKLMEREPLFWMQMLDQRGLQFPPGAVYGPSMSQSGSALREGDALFRSRLRNGEIPPGLGFSDLKAGQVPTAADVAKLLRAYAFTVNAQTMHNESVLAGQVSYTQEALSQLPTSQKLDWKPPKNGSPEEMERWRSAAVPWIETATRVKTYADTIAAYNFATTTQGRDWPSLTDAFKALNGVDKKTTVFPDDALKDPDFPGKITRNSNGTISVDLEMPEGLDRNNPANMAKIEKMERWLAKWSPDVDKVTKELALAMQDQNRMLLHVEDGEVERKHTIKKEEVDAFKKANAEDPRRAGSPSILKGDDSDVGKFVKLPNGQSDWRVKAVKPDGSYELERRAPNGEEYNLKRYSFDTVKCDKDGKENPNGAYVKVTGYQDYLWARDHCYNNWDFIPWGIKNVDRKVTMEPKVFHQNEFVPIIDNGRMRLMPAGKLGDWRAAQEQSKQTGNVVNAIVDAGMLVSGVYEARAGWMAAKALGEKSMFALAKAAVKEGAWHFGLGATGFGKQFIENRLPYGHEMMKVRHWLILADITVGMLPGAAQKAFWNSVNIFKWGKTAKEAESAVEAYKLGRVMAEGTEIPLKLRWYDSALQGAHKLYEGWKVGDKIPVLGKVIPPLGAFPLADMYFLAQFSDTIASVQDKKDPQRGKIYDAMERHKIARDKDKPLYANPSEATEEQFKKAMKPAIDEYTKRLGLSNSTQTGVSEQINNALKEAIKLPANSPDRVKLSLKLAEDWKTANGAQKTAIAAALLELSKDASGKYPEQVMGISSSDLQQQLARSPETIARKTAEMMGKAVSDDAREAYKLELANIYKTANEPAAKAVAAKALLELSQGKDGSLVALKKEAALDISSVKSYFSKTPEGLLERLPETILKGPDNAERQQLAKDAASIFESRTSSEKEKLAASIVLLSLRGGDSLNSPIAQTSVKSEQLLKYLNDRVRNSEDPEVKIAAGDLLFRSAQMTTANLQERVRLTAEGEKKLDDANSALAKSPDNEDLKNAAKAAKEELERLKSAQNDTHEFLKKVNYSGADFASTLMSVIQSEKTPRQVKLDAIASTNGPRLAAILQHLKYNVEPGLLRNPDDNARIDGLGGLYGRDSKTIEKFLSRLAGDVAADRDVRALASQTLGMLALDRTTVNGVPASPGATLKIGTAGDVKLEGEGISPAHAEFRVSSDGKKLIAAQDGPVWIVRNGEYISVAKGKFQEFKPTDSIILGDKEKGKALFFSNERTDALAELASKAKNMGNKPGAISDAYVNDLRKILENPLPPSTGLTANQRAEILVSRLQAAQAAKDLGSDIFGNNKDKAQKIISDALADCVQSGFPELAIAALAKLDAASLANMSIEKADKVRETAFEILKNTPIDDVGFALREALVHKIPEIFEGASKLQQGKAQRYLESILVPGAREQFFSQDKKTSYPPYVAARPEVRVAALESIAKMNPDKAGEIASLLLTGGNYYGKKVEADFPAVRLEAVKTLEKVLPLEVHEIALHALRTEKDPAVLARLWNLEYGQRPDMDPVKAMQKVQELENLIGARAKQGLLNDGEAAYNAISRNGDDKLWLNSARSLASGFSKYGRKEQDLFGPEAVEARKALIYATTHPELGSNNAELAAINLLQTTFVENFNAKGDLSRVKKLAAELTGPLEAALLNNPSMQAEARRALVSAYLNLKPGENGIVSKDEAAVVLARVLEAELKRMPRIPIADYDEYGKSVALQEKIVSALKELKSEKIAPILDGLSYKEPIKSFDTEGRPKTVSYGEVTRKFEYDKQNQLLKFTEYPSGKVFERDQKEPRFFVSKTGEKIEAPSVQLQRASQITSDAYPWSKFDEFNVKGDVGDFTFKKDGKSYVQKPNGTVIEEELNGDSRKVTVTYPGGKESKEFLFKKNEKDISVVVTSKPDNKTENWTMSYGYGSYSINGKGPDGQPIHSIHSNTFSRNSIGMSTVPWNFDKGTYHYVDGGRDKIMRFVDSNGAVYEKNGPTGSEQKVKAGYGDAAAHPLSSISSAAKSLYDSQRESSDLARTEAEAEIQHSSKNDPESIFKTPDSSKLADFMGKELGDTTADGYSVSKKIHMGMLAKPIENENDPRLTVLREALRDGNDMVRLTAAQYLMNSPLSLDRAGIAAACADIVKNGTSTSRAQQAQAILEQLKRIDSTMVEKAIADTPDKQRLEGDGRPDSAGVKGDVKYQNAFERIRASLLEGPKDILSWKWDKWAEVTKDLNLDLLNWSGRHKAEWAAESQMLSNLGSLDKFLMKREELEAKKKEARESVKPQVWAALDSLVLKGMKDGDDSQGVLARKALAFIVMSNGAELGLDAADKKVAVDKAVDAITKICKDNGPGRGDMTWIVQSLLTEKVDLSADNKKKLVDALDSLASPDKGKMSAENAAGIASLALEQEMRFMPRPGQEGYDQSIAYQKRLIETIQKFGNKETLPALQYFAKQHADASVRDAADKAQKDIIQKKNDGVARVVEQMISSEAGAKFTAIRSDKDQRIPFLVAALNDPKLSEEKRMRAAELLLAPENKGLKENDLKLAGSVYAKLALKNGSEDVRYRAADLIMDKTNANFTDEHRFAASRVMAELAQSAASEQIRAKAVLSSEKLDGSDAAAAAQGSLDVVARLKPDNPENIARIEKALEASLKQLEASDKLSNSQSALIRAAVLANSSLGPDHPLSKKFADMFNAMAESPKPLEIKDASDPRLSVLKDAITSGDHNLKMAALAYTLKANATKSDAISPIETIKLAVDETARLAMGDSADKPFAVSLMKNLRAENIDVALARISKEFPKQEAYDLISVMPADAARKLMSADSTSTMSYVDKQRALGARVQQDHNKLLSDPKYGEMIKNYMKAIGESSEFKMPPQLAVKPELLQKHMDHLLKLYKGSDRSAEAEAELLRSYMLLSKMPEAKSPQLAEMSQLLEKAAADMKARPLAADDPRLPVVNQMLSSPEYTNEKIKAGLAAAILDSSSGIKSGDPLRALAYKAMASLSESKDPAVKAVTEKVLTEAVARIKNPIDKNDPELKDLMSNLPARGSDKARLELAQKILSSDSKLTKADYKLWADAWRQVIGCIGSSDASVNAEAKKQIDSIDANNPNKIHLLKEFLSVAQSRFDGTDKRNNEFWETFKTVLDKFETKKSDSIYQLVDKWLRENPNTGNEAEDLEKKAMNSSRNGDDKLWSAAIAAREKVLPADSIELAQARMRAAAGMMKGEGYYYNAAQIKTQTELALATFKKQAPDSVETADVISKAAQILEKTREYDKAASLHLEAAEIYSKNAGKRVENAQCLAKAAEIQMQRGEMNKALENVAKIHALLKNADLNDHDKTMMFAAFCQTLKPMMVMDKNGSREKALTYLKEINEPMSKLKIDGLSVAEANQAFESFWWVGQTITDNRDSSKEVIALSFNAYERALEAGVKGKGEKDTSTIGLFGYYASILERNGQPEKAKIYKDKYEKMMAERSSVPAGVR